MINQVEAGLRKLVIDAFGRNTEHSSETVLISRPLALYEAEDYEAHQGAVVTIAEGAV